MVLFDSKREFDSSGVWKIGVSVHLFHHDEFSKSVEWRKQIIKQRLSRAASERRAIRQDTFIPPTLPNNYAYRERPAFSWHRTDAHAILSNCSEVVELLVSPYA